MRLDEPSWWYAPPGDVRARLLAPLAAVYAWVGERRIRRTQAYRSRLPVVCVGNFTAGGTGKTPLALAIARHLADKGEHPVFLSRGYKSRHKGPRWVDADHDTAAEVGDEPLLLARAAPVMIARDRRLGAIAIEQDNRPASVIVMDDGLQNPALAKDLAIAVVDGRRGFGNGAVIPAGPLRARLDLQLALADAIVVNRPPATQAASQVAEGAVLDDLRRHFPGPVLAATPVPAGDVAALVGASVVAYAGIANPDRFFRLLESLGAALAARHAFPDHHAFGESDAHRLLADAAQRSARLVTTEKDLVRLTGLGGRRKELMEASTAVPIALAFDGADGTRLADLIASAVRTGGYRSGLAPRRARTASR